MTEHEDRSRWGSEDPDALDPSDAEVTADENPEAPDAETDEEPIVAVQPGEASDVPWEENQAVEAQPDDEGEGE